MMMSLFAPLFALLAASAAAPAEASPPRPAEVRFYKDWYAVCDNGGACEAGIAGQDFNFDAAMVLRVRRATGPDGYFSILIQSQLENVTGASLSVDGKELASGAIDEEGRLVIGRDKALAIARALAEGRVAEVSFSAPRVAPAIEQVTLAGSSAALRYMDAEQMRAGTVDAIVAVGASGYAAAPPPLPQIGQQPPDPGGEVPMIGQMMAIARPADCELPEGFDRTPTFDKLGRDASHETAIILMPCNSGAYNFTSVVFVAQRAIGGKAWTIEPAKFDFGDNMWSDDGPLQLVNAFFDADSGRLATYAKGRGIGDCGSADSYVFDGSRFRLVERRDMPECRGVWEWPTVWRASAVPYKR